MLRRFAPAAAAPAAAPAAAAPSASPQRARRRLRRQIRRGRMTPDVPADLFGVLRTNYEHTIKDVKFFW